jgi:hypothetical protein
MPKNDSKTPAGHARWSFPPTNIEEEARSQLPAEAQWAVERLEQLGELEHLAAGIQTGNTIAIADGTFKDIRGTSGFALIHGDSHQGINEANQVPGEDSDQASYRSELAGVYDALLLAQMICKIYYIETGHMAMAYNNESAGQKAIDWHYPPKPSNDHFDMLNVIHQLRQLLPITTEFQHVEAHQREKYGSRKALNKWAIWNDKMDSFAKAYWLFTREAPPCSSKLVYGKEWAVWVKWWFSRLKSRSGVVYLIDVAKRIWPQVDCDCWGPPVDGVQKGRSGPFSEILDPPFSNAILEVRTDST